MAESFEGLPFNMRKYHFIHRNFLGYFSQLEIIEKDPLEISEIISNSKYATGVIYILKDTELQLGKHMSSTVFR